MPLTMNLVCTMLFTVGVLSLPLDLDAEVSSGFDAGGDNQAGLTFTPDGKRAFWTEWNGSWGSDGAQRIIYTAERAGDGWTEPVPAPFTGQHSDDDPFVSPDGQWLYFVSERPADDSDRLQDADIWRFSLAEHDRLERLSINSAAAEYSPVLTSSGALYFASARDGGVGQGDIYRAAAMGDGFDMPEVLGTAINSATGEWNVWVADDESEMIFEASSRPTNLSVPGDLYYSCRTSAVWASAVPIESLNSTDSDLLPRLHPNGVTLYYTTAPLGGHARIMKANWTELRPVLRAASSRGGQRCRD